MSAEKESELELDELEAQFSEVRFFFHFTSVFFKNNLTSIFTLSFPLLSSICLGPCWPLW